MIGQWPPRKFLVINLVIGGLAFLSNGAAAAVMFARQSSLDWLEAGVWAAAGFALVALSSYGLKVQKYVEAVLRIQLWLIAGLVAFLAAWAVSLQIYDPMTREAEVAWAAGYMTALAIYCAFLSSRVYGKDDYLPPFFWFVFVPVSVLVDVTTFIYLI